MPTRNRRRFIARAVRCWLAQTYEPRELLVVDDGEDAIEDALPVDPRIRYVRVSRASTLGAKRNAACELASGELIAHWDDDDWYAPERIAQQVAAGGEVNGYQSCVFWDEVRLRAYRYDGPPRTVLGTSLSYRRDWWQSHPFEARQIGEDVKFYQRAAQLKALTVLEGGAAVVAATTHGAGTSPRRMDKQWTPIEKSEVPEDYWIV